MLGARQQAWGIAEVEYVILKERREEMVLDWLKRELHLKGKKIV